MNILTQAMRGLRLPQIGLAGTCAFLIATSLPLLAADASTAIEKTVASLPDT